MPRTCTVCRHDQLAEIDFYRADVEPGRGIEPLTCSLRVSRSAD